MKIAVAGTGYVGLVTGVCLASKGHEVTCVDVDENKVKIMKNGDSPIYEPGLSELMKEHKIILYLQRIMKKHIEKQKLFLLE